MQTTFQLGAKAVRPTSKTVKCFAKHTTERKETDSSAANEQFCNSGVEVQNSTFVLLLKFCTLAECFGFDCPAIAKLPDVVRYMTCCEKINFC